jgi:hypothetical protein
METWGSKLTPKQNTYLIAHKFNRGDKTGTIDGPRNKARYSRIGIGKLYVVRRPTKLGTFQNVPIQQKRVSYIVNSKDSGFVH